METQARLDSGVSAASPLRVAPVGLRVHAGYTMRELPGDPSSSSLFILAQTDVKGLIPKVSRGRAAPSCNLRLVKRSLFVCLFVWPVACKHNCSARSRGVGGLVTQSVSPIHQRARPKPASLRPLQVNVQGASECGPAKLSLQKRAAESDTPWSVQTDWRRDISPL